MSSFGARRYLDAGLQVQTNIVDLVAKAFNDEERKRAFKSAIN